MMVGYSHAVVIFSLLSIASANYVVHVEIHSYNNPTGDCANCTDVSSFGTTSRRCCDPLLDDGIHLAPPCIEEEICDPGFALCLLPINGSFCSSNREVSTYFHSNTDSETFSEGIGLDGLQGLSNRWMGVKLHIRVNDADNILANGTNPSISDDDTIDEFYINITTPIGTLTDRTLYTGIHGFVRLELSFRVSCADNYDGEFCENLNECMLNSETCNERGRCIDDADSFTCVCDPGYTGTRCEEPDECFLNSVTCSGNGRCVDGQGSFMCVCDPGYNGTRCQEPDECFLNSVTCSGNGRCVDGEGSFMCECDPGYNGTRCEEPDECFLNSMTCSGNGRCVDGQGSFMCVCDPGYTGTLCDQHEEDHSNVTVILCSQVFQLLLGPIHDCQEWRFDNPGSKANSITTTLIGEIQCSECEITNPEFSCNTNYPKSSLYRATIAGNTTLSCNRSVQSLTSWVQSESASVLVQTNRLQIDPNCEVAVSSNSAALNCERTQSGITTVNSPVTATTTADSKEENKSNTLTYTIIGVCGGLVAVGIITTAVVTGICCAKNKLKGPKAANPPVDAPKPNNAIQEPPVTLSLTTFSTSQGNNNSTTNTTITTTGQHQIKLELPSPVNHNGYYDTVRFEPPPVYDYAKAIPPPSTRAGENGGPGEISVGPQQRTERGGVNSNGTLSAHHDKQHYNDQDDNVYLQVM